MAKMNRSYFFKTVGVLFLLALILVVPVVGQATENQQPSNDEVVELLGRIPGLKRGTPFVPILPTDIDPGTFIINLVPYEKHVLVDDKFACIISYAYSANSPSVARNTKVSLTLSEEMQFIEFYDQDENQLDVDIQLLQNGQTQVTFNVAPSIAPGFLGNVIAVTKFNSEKLSAEDTPFCSATITADNAPVASSEVVQVNPIFNPADWMLMTYKEYPTVTPPAGSDVSYGITLYGNSPNNGWDFEDVVLTVDYPKNAVVVETGGGTVDQANNKITWQYEKLLVDDVIEKSITLNYPIDYFTDETTNTSGKSNAVQIITSVSANVVGIGANYNIEDNVDHGFEPLTAKIGEPNYQKAFYYDKYSVGETATYTLDGVDNNGNTDFKTILVTYNVPDDLTVSHVETGKFNMDVNLVMYYKLEDSTSWREWADVSSLSSTKLSAGTLNISKKITNVRWVISEGNEKIRPGFTGRDTLNVASTVSGNFGDTVEASSKIKAEAETESGSALYAVSDGGDAFTIMTVMPDNLSAQRQLIVEKAFSLLGRVEYFWGGKSVAIGWDDRWGKSKYNPSAGRYEPYGLDCSGYVEWVYANSGFSASTVINDLGVGTVYQWPNSYLISPEDMLPGDLAFKQPSSAPGTNHVGIIVGRDNNGTLMVAHCSSAYNTVVVTPYAGTFYYMRRAKIMPD